MAALAVVMVWFVTTPLRADLQAASAIRAGMAGNLESSQEGLEEASELAPWVSIYPYQRARALEVSGNQEAALEAMERTAELEPGVSRYARQVAQLADVMGQEGLAANWYLQAAERDPMNIGLLRDVAEYLAAHGREETADRLRRRAEELAARA